jgi:hypothetical protein
MPRVRTGQLVYRAASGWNARMWMPVKNADGS